MAFNAYGAQSSGNNNASTIDYNALAEYVVKTCELENGEPMAGRVVGIADLGTQRLQASEYVFTGNADDEAAEIAKNPLVKFKDGVDRQSGNKPCRLKVVPNKDRQCVALAIEFPQILLDQGQFFGEAPGKMLPLRIWLQDEGWSKEAKVSIAQHPIALKVTKNELNTWSMSVKSTPYKMALAAGIIKEKQPFLPTQIDELVGKCFMFEPKVYVDERDGKKYLKKKVKFVSKLGRGAAEPPVGTEPFVLDLEATPPFDVTKELPAYIRNTIRMATNYPKSKWASLLGDPIVVKSNEEEQPEQAQQQAPVKAPVVQAKVALDDASEDCPF